ncbi:hypothetical protein MKK69_04100 [Methylobacterium sp. J-026]|uniref:hypothetical protein n=1 Tax=Methylobacterium sp. J-026 TaxID=2836624 RepID=UPI001FB9C12E|nr:hypothetical protein [Methylobacterium sp. J-026]MCJ2133255.1 hypothetical protein [Methylobacterium sp. J-026]
MSRKIHRYSSCSTHSRQGKTSCTGRSIRMETLDALVTDHPVAELLHPDRLRARFASLWSVRADKAIQVDGRVAALRRESAGAEEKLKRLYRMIEEGMTDLDDNLRDRLAALKRERDRAEAALDRIHVNARPRAEIAPELIERVGRLMHEAVTTGEIPFRKARLQAIVDPAEVGADVIRIVGGKTALETASLDAGSAATPGVRVSVENGAPDTIRTCDLCLRRITLACFPVITRDSQSPPRH